MVLRWVAWAGVVVIVCMWAGMGEAADLSKCRSGCHQVPEDLWPRCCESHNTCCEEFADSCMHDCLPRVHTGDVSVVEERPGLCCALYNLCCFRETLRLTSRKTGKETPASFPIIHRFHTPAFQTHQPIRSPPTTLASVKARQPLQEPKESQPESSPKRPSLFRPQPPKKPNIPLIPQSLTKSSSDIEEQDLPAGGKRIAQAGDGERRATLTEVKKLRRPKPFSSSLLGGRKNAGGSDGEPKESLGPQRPAFRPFSAVPQGERGETDNTGVGEAGKRPGNRRSKITLKRLRRPVSEEGNTQANTQDRISQGERLRPSQQDVRQRPEQATRQRPSQQQSSRIRPQQVAQTTDARRGGRTQSSDSVTLGETILDHSPAAGSPVIILPNPLSRPPGPQVLPNPLSRPPGPQVHEVIPDLPQIAVDDQLVRIQEAGETAPEATQNANAEVTDTVRVSADMMEDEAKHSTVIEETDQVGDANTEVDIIEIPGETTQAEGTETAAQTVVEDTVPDQPQQTDLIPQESVVGTEVDLSQASVFPEHHQTLKADKVIQTNINQDTSEQPTNRRPQQSGVQLGNQEASQARTRTGTRPATRTRVTADSRGSSRAQTTRTRSSARTTDQTSTRGQTRSRSSSRRNRVQAQAPQAVASERRQGRRFRRQ